MNPVSGYSKLNYLKNQVLLKSKIRFGYVFLPILYFDQSSAHLLMFS